MRIWIFFKMCEELACSIPCIFVSEEIFVFARGFNYRHNVEGGAKVGLQLYVKQFILELLFINYCTIFHKKTISLLLPHHLLKTWNLQGKLFEGDYKYPLVCYKYECYWVTKRNKTYWWGYRESIHLRHESLSPLSLPLKIKSLFLGWQHDLYYSVY